MITEVILSEAIETSSLYSRLNFLHWPIAETRMRTVRQKNSNNNNWYAMHSPPTERIITRTVHIVCHCLLYLKENLSRVDRPFIRSEFKFASGCRDLEDRGLASSEKIIILYRTLLGYWRIYETQHVTLKLIIYKILKRYCYDVRASTF